MKAIYQFFNSLKLTVYLILAITFFTMSGSMVLYFRQDLFGDMDQDLLFHWLLTKGVNYPAYTWWLYLLVVLVVLLGMNTLVCSIERLPALVKRYRDPLMGLRDMEVGGDSGKPVAIAEGPGEALTGFLGRRGYKVFTEGDRFYAEKNRWLPFMPYVVHAGIMVFMAGHLISGLYGYRNTGLYIMEGQSVKSPAGDYMLRLDKVDVKYYPDGNLKDFGSRLTAIKDGKVIKSGLVTANSPMFVEGGAVYQRQYGKDVAGIQLQVEAGSEGRSEALYVPRENSYADIPGTPYRISVDKLIPDFALDENGAPVTRSDEMENPAVFVTLHGGKTGKAGGWLILNGQPGEFNDDGVRVRFTGMDMKAYSSFDVNRDPSALLVLAASLTVMIGTIVTLYFRRERVWATVDEEGKRAQVMCTDYELYEDMEGMGWS